MQRNPLTRQRPPLWRPPSYSPPCNQARFPVLPAVATPSAKVAAATAVATSAATAPAPEECVRFGSEAPVARPATPPHKPALGAAILCSRALASLPRAEPSSAGNGRAPAARPPPPELHWLLCSPGGRCSRQDAPSPAPAGVLTLRARCWEPPSWDGSPGRRPRARFGLPDATAYAIALT